MGTATRWMIGKAMKLMRIVTGSAVAIRSHTGRLREKATPKSGAPSENAFGMISNPAAGYGRARNAIVARCREASASCYDAGVVAGVERSL